MFYFILKNVSHNASQYYDVTKLDSTWGTHICIYIKYAVHVNSPIFILNFTWSRQSCSTLVRFYVIGTMKLNFKELVLPVTVLDQLVN